MDPKSYSLGGWLWSSQSGGVAVWKGLHDEYGDYWKKSKRVVLSFLTARIGFIFRA